ncbi:MULTISPECIES: hypothetical protein [unclassified Sphingomonas]|uniref:hypothetical protein n=1 Tax=unclassified Sphingomonas TaxID=196159 RepID=UPI000E105CA7|nr:MULTISPECIES: hypothetical protein [unclassified Sphingomonas]AXJ95250.1 hypothetical protein DM480_06765 [Sphingomonas sp. FARSPH]
MSDPLDVSGAWDGIFSYPRGLPPNGFACELREHGGRIDGETHERAEVGADRGTTIFALIEGMRQGHAVRFTKRYDDPRRAAHPVLYDGTLSADGDEIAGRWEIAGQWSGGFIMVRQQRRGAAAERKIAETVR